jgi:putative permease
LSKLAWYTAVSLATIALVFLLWEFQIALILFILSLMVAAILRPLVNFLIVRGSPRGLALVITYAAVFALIAGLGLFIGGPIITELQSVATDLPGSYEQLKNQWLTSSSWFQQAIAQSLPNFNNLFPIITSGPNNAFIQKILGLALGSFGLVSNLMIVVVLSIYWSIDQEHIKRLWLSLFPADLRIRWRDVWQNIESEIGAYLRSELLQSLLTVILLGTGYQLIGLKYPFLLAAIGAVGWLLVWFGGLVAVVPSLLVGLSINPTVGLLAALFTIAVLVFLEFIVEPRLFNRQRVSSLSVFILVLFLVKEYGIIGLLAAPPLAATIQIIASQFIRPPTTAKMTLAPPPTIQIDLLKERLNSIRTEISERSEPPAPEIINLIDRLDKLIDKTNHEGPFFE